METGTTELDRINITVDKKLGRIISSYSDRSDECILLTISAFYELVIELYKMFGDDYWLIMQKAGEGAGRISAKSFPTIEHEKIEPIRSAFNDVSRWGFGRYELKEIDIKNGIVIFELHDSVFEYGVNHKEYLKLANEQHFLIGFYKGLFSTLFGKKVNCTCSLHTDKEKRYYKFKVDIIESFGNYDVSPSSKNLSPTTSSQQKKDLC